MLTEEEIINKVKEKFGDKILQIDVPRKNRVRIEVDKNDMVELGKFLKDELGFTFPSVAVAVDFKTHFEMLYHVGNYDTPLIVVFKCKLPRDDPKMESMTPIWDGFNWHEREAYDLMGIVFENHPNLTRIYLIDEFEGHPLRKDYPVSGYKDELDKKLEFLTEKHYKFKNL